MVPDKNTRKVPASGRRSSGSAPGDASGIPDGAAFGESLADPRPDGGPPGRRSHPSHASKARMDKDVVTPDLHPDEAAAGGAGKGDPELELDLGAELELAQEQAAEHLQLAQRVQAEFENFRKRMTREQEDAIRRAGQRIVEELLPVLDNLERAIDHTTAGGDITELLKGVEMVHAQMIDVLAKEGVVVDDPFGRPFDPSSEQAVGQREDPEVEEGTVVDVYQKGYLMGGRVIRPAMVVVSTGGPRRREE